MSFRRESGQGKVGCIIWALAFAVAALVAYKMIPIRVNVAELKDFMDEQAMFAYNAPPERLKKAIVDKARELELPIDPKAVKVELVRDHIVMEVRFTVPVEFPGYTYNWEFHLLVDKVVFAV